MAGEVTRDMTIRIGQAGGERVIALLEQIAKGLDETGKASDRAGEGAKRHAAETSKVTGFVREQRTEQRTQNFLFREAKDAIGSVTFGFMALSGAAGTGTDSMKKLNSTLVTGYSAFQAADFAMAGLGVATGGTALAIAGLVGGGAALFSFLDDSAEKAKEGAKQFERWKAGLEGMSAAQLEAEGIQQQKVLSGREAINKENQPHAKAGVIGWLMSKLGKVDESEVKAKLEVLDQKFIEIDKDREERHKKIRADALSGLDLQLGMEKLITGEMVRRMQLQIENNMRERGVDITTEGMLAGRKLWDTAGNKIFDTPYLGKLKAKGVKLDKGFDIEKSLMGAMQHADMLNQKELVFLGLLDQGVGTLRTTMSFLGIETDSFIGKMLQGLDIALSIAKTIQAISSIGSILGALTGNPLAIAGAAGITGAGGPNFRREQFIETYKDAARKGML